MKILHYLHGLPPVRNGGLVKYALDLAQGEYESGNDVQLLVPGSFRRQYKGKTEIRSGMWEQLPCHYIVNPLPVTEGRRIEHIEFLLERECFEVFFIFLKKISPDLIHIHSFMGIGCSFLEAAKKLEIPVVFTTHDYYGLCPKVNLFRKGKNCARTDWQECALCMGAAVPLKKIIWRHSGVYRTLKANRFFQWLEYSPRLLPYKIYVKSMLKKRKNVEGSMQEQSRNATEASGCQVDVYEPLREYYLRMYKSITCFHFNSKQSRRIFESYLGKVRGEVIPITNRTIKDNRRIYEYDGKLKIGYLGGGQPFKGYQYMKEALDSMYRSGMTEFECHIYFNDQDLNCPYLRRHEPYQGREMETVFRNMDVLVMPSLWRESFGMVVLEALSYGVPVVISSYVGAKELLEDNPGMGIIIDPDENRDCLREEIERIYHDRCVLERMNRNIYEWEYKWSFSEHITKMTDLYHNEIEKNGRVYL